MSRSYRKPYTAITGTQSAHADKKMASRGLRRHQKQWLHNLNDPERDLVPHRLECPWNNTYSWGRDGRQRLAFPDSQGPDHPHLIHRHWLRLHRK